MSSIFFLLKLVINFIKNNISYSISQNYIFHITCKLKNFQKLKMAPKFQILAEVLITSYMP